jgi:hypothetical protein
MVNRTIAYAPMKLRGHSCFPCKAHHSLVCRNTASVSTAFGDRGSREVTNRTQKNAKNVASNQPQTGYVLQYNS